jgi:hypothetical protein
MHDLIQRLGDFVISFEPQLAIHQFAWVAPGHSTELFAVRSHGSFPRTDDSRFEWLFSDAEAQDVLASLSSLADRASGHQYFQLVDSDARLMVSVGEHDGIWSPAAG